MTTPAETKTQGRTLGELVHLAPSVIAIFAAMSLAMSIVYEYGYFIRIGFSFFLLLSISDHLASLITDLPKILMVWFCLLVSLVGGFHFAMYAIRLQTKIATKYPRYKYTKILVFGLMFTLLSLFAIALFGKPHSIPIFLSGTAVMASLLKLLYSVVAENKRTVVAFIIGLLVMSIMAFMGSLGHLFAHFSLSSDGHQIKLILSDDTTMQVRLLRYTSNYLISFSTATHTVVAIPLDRIELIERIY